MHELITRRRSPVIFSSTPVSDGQVRLLVEAAQWAPSSFNQQPWRFVYAHRADRDEWDALFNLLLPGNQEWVKHRVPLLMLSLAERIIPGRNRENVYAQHDVGLATGNLLLQATAMDLFVHPMGGFDREQAVRVLEIPEPYQPLTMFAVGYAGEADGIPEDMVIRDRAVRKRNSLDTVYFKGKWGKQAAG